MCVCCVNNKACASLVTRHTIQLGGQNGQKLSQREENNNTTFSLGIQ